MAILSREASRNLTAAIGLLVTLLPLVFVTFALMEGLGVAYLSPHVAFFAADPAGLSVSNLFWPAIFLGGLLRR